MKGEKAYDIVSLGEVMLRLDPGDCRISQARQFTPWEGGGEYNVARAFCSCFGLKAAVVSSFVENEVGRLLFNLIKAGGVCTQWIRFVEDDGIGESVRNGLNFTERGFGVRGAVGCSDRGRSAASQIQPQDFPWHEIFSQVHHLHTGGIFASLSDSTALTVSVALNAARQSGVTISFDLNYRPSLWKRRGGRAAAAAFFSQVVKDVDFLFGSEEDYALLLGEEGVATFPQVLTQIRERFPQLKGCGASSRQVLSATRNRWQGWFFDGRQIYNSRSYELEIFDRVGGGDGFVSGFLAALRYGENYQTAVEWGAAHGALVMTTPGDVSWATLKEVKTLAMGSESRIQR